MIVAGTVIYRGDRETDTNYDNFTLGKQYAYTDEGDDTNEGYWDGLITVTNDNGEEVEAMSIDFDYPTV